LFTQVGSEQLTSYLALAIADTILLHSLKNNVSILMPRIEEVEDDGI